MLRNLKELEKCTISSFDGNIGHVDQLFFDDQTWVIRYLVVDAGTWLLSRRVLISPIAVERVDLQEKRLYVALTRDQVRDSPDIDTRMPVSRQMEMQYFTAGPIIRRARECGGSSRILAPWCRRGSRRARQRRPRAPFARISVSTATRTCAVPAR
jgi:hypothetical protein